MGALHSPLSRKQKLAIATQCEYTVLKASETKMSLQTLPESCSVLNFS